MIVLGVTGGIACGKTTVTGYMQKNFGLPCIDMDQISRDVVRPGSRTYFRIKNAFPEVFPKSNSSSELPPFDRAALGRIIFADQRERKKLNQIMFVPLIWELLKNMFFAYWRGTDILVVSAPLLYEAKLDRICTAVLVVFVEPESLQIERLMKRDCIDREQAKCKIDAQMPLQEKKCRAHFCIDNSRTREETIRELEDVMVKVKKLKPWLPRNTLISCLGLFCLSILVIYFWLRDKGSN